MKKSILKYLFSFVFVGILNAQQTSYAFQDSKLPIEKRIDDLLGLLTTEEKVGMMMNSSKAVDRLGIPAYDWWNEALHGVARAGYATVFPQAIGMAATWNVPLHQKTFEIISDEARAKYNQRMQEAGNTRRYEGLSFWTPNINIFRDPRWGRGQETYGEDPYLTTKLGLAAVKGLQGNDPNYYKTHACAKHFAVHSGPEWNRHSYNAVISKRDLYETYLPAFKALVTEGNVREVMCAYNAFDGEPCCANNTLLTEILREKWKYDGMIVSDCWAVDDFFKKKTHQTHASPQAAVADAVKFSTDLECGNAYTNLPKAIKEGFIKESEIDQSLRRVLRGWLELGMLDPKSDLPWSQLSISNLDEPTHAEQALRVAHESMTLSKNQNKVLPLSKQLKRIAVIGPNANDSIMLLGNYNGTPRSTVTILEGIRRKLPHAEIIYEKACDVVDPTTKISLYQFLKTDEKGRSGLKVEFFNNPKFEGKPTAAVNNNTGISYTTYGGTELAPGVARENVSTKISGIFTAQESGDVVFSPWASDGYQFFIKGEKVLDRKLADARHPADFVYKVEKGKSYPIELKHVQVGGSVNIGFEVLKKEPVNYVLINEKVKDAEVIIFVGGLSPRLEGEEMLVNAEGFKGGDKISIDLPKVQREMLIELRKSGKPVIFVMNTGSAIALDQDEKNYDALLCSWYGGQAAGTAVADVLFGDYNPAGRLPVTFYKDLAQLDDALTKNSIPEHHGFENYDMQGRTYRYMKTEPMYAFGQGLSYSTFKYGNAKINSTKIKKEDGFTITIPIKNTSKIPGDEVVQVYIRKNDNPSVPVKTLRAFQRVNIPSNSEKSVELKIDKGAFEFYDEKANDLVTKSGKYTVFYGGSSRVSDLKEINVSVE